MLFLSFDILFSQPRSPQYHLSFTKKGTFVYTKIPVLMYLHFFAILFKAALKLTDDFHRLEAFDIMTLHHRLDFTVFQ